MAPVSYTHLDVYKRQLLALRRSDEKTVGAERRGGESDDQHPDSLVGVPWQGVQPSLATN